MEKELKKTGAIRDKQGKFVKGASGNLRGRPPENEDKKLRKKASKELIADYRDKLINVLPQLSIILINKALEGDMQAIKELHDRVMGKAPQSITKNDDEFTPIQVVLRAIGEDREKYKNS